MQIHPKYTGPVSPDTSKPAKSTDSATGPVDAVAPLSSGTGRSDSVSISDAGRALAARTGGTSSLDPQRAASIRNRVLNGAYDTLDVVDAVARRLLDSGHI